MCNSSITCRRVDGLYDCCATSIADCVIERFDQKQVPTFQPSNVQVQVCEAVCNSMPVANKCNNWYERPNLDLSCMSKYDTYCCSHSRDECCQMNIQYGVIVLGMVITAWVCIVAYAYYRYRVFMRTGIVPEISIV